MWPLSSAQPVAEYEASDDLDDVYHDIRQTLRVSGVNLVFQTLAGVGNALPIIWQALSPAVSVQGFEQASDGLRAKAVELGAAMGKLEARDAVQTGPSQSYQIQKALGLYHYINPKLLVIVAALRLAIEDERGPADVTGQRLSAAPVLRGEPDGMYPMELVPEEPDDDQLAAVFKEITEHYALSSINSDYRTLALWPDYLSAAWERMKRKSAAPAYTQAIEALHAEGRKQASRLPVPVALTRFDFEARITDAAAVRTKLGDFERALPPLILNIALMALDWQPADRLRHSPFPLEARHA
jgi:hypothetical protein